jgi:hypothetical protein
VTEHRLRADGFERDADEIERDALPLRSREIVAR